MIENILWDFDGVILDSMKIREWGFKEIFKSYKKNDIDKLIDYHNLNGGLSRYVKIRYFYEEILKKEIVEDKVLEYANNFTLLMISKLTNPNNLIPDSVGFIKDNYKKYNFHIVSGSDQNELRFLCEELKIDKYFISIHGSPTAKNQLVKNLIETHSYHMDKTCLIGDSVNDYEASKYNNILFLAYNNVELTKYNDIEPLY